MKINKKQYLIKNYNKKHLVELGFKYMYSDEDKGQYVYRFPIIKYNGKTTIEGVIIVNSENGNITVDVINLNSNSPYTPYYIIKYGRYDEILKKINTNVSRTTRRLGIIEKRIN